MRKCQFCGYELNPEIQEDNMCPACQFPNAGETKAVDAGTVTVPVKSITRGHPVQTGSLRAGSVSLTRKSEVYPIRKLLLIAFLIDISGSMLGKKSKKARASLLRMLQSLLPLGEHCQMALCEFNESPRIAHPLNSPAQLEGHLALSEADGATNIGAALRLGGDLLANHSVEKASDHLLVLLSDGEDTCNSCPLEEATRQKSAGKLIVTIAYGDDADHAMLQNIASSPDLSFAKGTNGDELEAFLKNLGDTTTASVQMGESLKRSLSRID